MNWDTALPLSVSGKTIREVDRACTEWLKKRGIELQTTQEQIAADVARARLAKRKLPHPVAKQT